MHAPSARNRSLLAALASVSVLVSGCGGGARHPSVASVATTTTTTPVSGSSTSTRSSTKAGSGATGAGSQPSQAQLHQGSLQYAQCMRASGVPDFPDPKAGGGFSFQAGAGIDPSSPTFKAAQAKCTKLLPGGGPPAPGSTTHPSAAWLAQMVKAAQCMREHGIGNFPDPRTSVPANPFPAGSGGGTISEIEGVILVFPATLDTQSPLFTRAANTCRFPLHNH